MTDEHKIILLADDDADDREIFREALAAANCSARLFQVDTGAGVFEHFANPLNPIPDLIFLDLNMPVMNGWQCLAKLKNTKGMDHIPVIMYTTSSNVRDVQIARDLDAHGLITKPSNPNILIKVLSTIICDLDATNLKQNLEDAYLMTKQ